MEIVLDYRGIDWSLDQAGLGPRRKRNRRTHPSLSLSPSHAERRPKLDGAIRKPRAEASPEPALVLELELQTVREKLPATLRPLAAAAPAAPLAVKKKKKIVHYVRADSSFHTENNVREPPSGCPLHFIDQVTAGVEPSKLIPRACALNHVWR